MTTTAALLEDLDVIVSDFIAVLNAKEVARRVEVNANHFSEYGRLLYPEGGQYVTYTAEKGGRKYTRIVETQVGGGRSVHCFIDKATGDVLKGAGWARPARGARYNLLDADSRATLYERCEFAGGYLYANRLGRGRGE